VDVTTKSAVWTGGPAYRVTANWTGVLTLGVEYRLVWNIPTELAKVYLADSRCTYRDGYWYFTPLTDPIQLVFSVLMPAPPWHWIAAARVAEPAYVCDATGFDLSVWEHHALRFHKRLLNDRSINVRLVNKRGRLEVKNVIIAGKVGRHAYKDR